jgi:hypothetical protein
MGASPTPRRCWRKGRTSVFRTIRGRQPSTSCNLPTTSLRGLLRMRGSRTTRLRRRRTRSSCESCSGELAAEVKRTGICAPTLRRPALFSPAAGPRCFVGCTPHSGFGAQRLILGIDPRWAAVGPPSHSRVRDADRLAFVSDGVEVPTRSRLHFGVRYRSQQRRLFVRPAAAVIARDEVAPEVLLDSRLTPPFHLLWRQLYAALRLGPLFHGRQNQAPTA